MKTIQLTSAELKFLGDFLDDGLHRELEIRREQDLDRVDPIARKFLPTIISKIENDK